MQKCSTDYHYGTIAVNHKINGQLGSDHIRFKSCIIYKICHISYNKINIRFISSVELQKVMADLGERLTEEEVHTNKNMNTKIRKMQKYKEKYKHKYM